MTDIPKIAKRDREAAVYCMKQFEKYDEPGGLGCKKCPQALDYFSGSCWWLSPRALSFFAALARAIEEETS